MLVHLAAAFVAGPAEPAGSSLLMKETLAGRCEPCVDVAASDDPSVSSLAILPAFFVCLPNLMISDLLSA